MQGLCQFFTGRSGCDSLLNVDLPDGTQVVAIELPGGNIPLGLTDIRRLQSCEPPTVALRLSEHSFRGCSGFALLGNADRLYVERSRRIRQIEPD